MNHDEKGEKAKVDLTLEQANPEDYDALVLPGGVANPIRFVPRKTLSILLSISTRQKGGGCHLSWSLDLD